MESADRAHTSSHWRHYGPTNSGYGNMLRAGPAELIGTYRLAFTSAQRGEVLRAFPMARATACRMGLAFTQDSVRQLCTLVLLQPYITPQSRLLLIGDGFGLLAGLIRATYPTADVALVDLSFTLREQETRLVRSFGADGFTFTHAAKLDTLADQRFTLAINVASMQEMDPPEVARYFKFIRGPSLPI